MQQPVIIVLVCLGLKMSQYSALLLVLCILCTIHAGTAQTGRCTATVSRPVASVGYRTMLVTYQYSCGAFSWSQCTGYRYRRVSTTSYRTAYSTVTQCCTGYQTAADGTCRPACSSGCANGGTCISPDTCACLRGYYGKDCRTRSLQTSNGEPLIRVGFVTKYVTLSPSNNTNGFEVAIFNGGLGNDSITLHVSTHDGTAKELVDYNPVNITFKLNDRRNRIHFKIITFEATVPEGSIDERNFTATLTVLGSKRKRRDHGGINFEIGIGIATFRIENILASSHNAVLSEAIGGTVGGTAAVLVLVGGIIGIYKMCYSE